MSTLRTRRWKWLWAAPGLMLVALSIAGLYRNKTLGRALEIVCAGHELEVRGDIAAALEQYRAAVAIQPRFPYGLALLGNAYHQLGEDDKAIESYKRALTFSPRHFWVHYLLGQLYRDQGRYQEAIAKFNELLTMKDNWYQSNQGLGYVQYQQLAYGELGHCYAKLGETRKAVEAYQQYLTLNPSAKDRAVVEEYIQRATGNSAEGR